MKKLLVIVPFPMIDENRALREAPLKSVELGPDISFDERLVRAAPKNNVRASDLALAERLPVPVISPGPLSYKLAEACLCLGLSRSRAAHPAAIVPGPAMIHAMLETASANHR